MNLEPKKEKSRNTSRARARRRLINKPPQEEQAQNELANEMLDWVDQDESYTLEDFPISKSMAPSRFYRCAMQNEYFAEALDLARYTISSRLQKDLRSKRLDKDYVLRLLPLYNQEYKSLILDKIDKTKEEQNKNITVVMEKFCGCEDKGTEVVKTWESTGSYKKTSL
jgi:hypothetical protein